MREGVISKPLLLSAKPNKDLSIALEADERLRFQPSNIYRFNNTETEAKFTVLGTTPGVYSVSYIVGGTNKNTFERPDNQELYTGVREYNGRTIFERLSLTFRELPHGEHVHEENDLFSCKLEFSSTAPWMKSYQKGAMTKGVVHVKSKRGLAFPLSLIGVELRNFERSQSQVLKDLIENSNSPAQQSDLWLLQLLQNDSFPVYLMQRFSDLAPCWASFVGHKNDLAFSVLNTFGSVHSPPKARDTNICTELPFLSNATAVFYRPRIVTEITIGQTKALFPTNSISCIGVDMCHSSSFLVFSKQGSLLLGKLPLFQNMKEVGWDLKVQAFGFSSNNGIQNKIHGTVWNGLGMESLNPFSPDLWFRGSAHIAATSSNNAGNGFRFSLHIDGEALIGFKKVEKVSI